MLAHGSLDGHYPEQYHAAQPGAVRDFPLLLLCRPLAEAAVLVQHPGAAVRADQAEYDYWEALNKNTESIGSINDPLPAA